MASPSREVRNYEDTHHHGKGAAILPPARVERTRGLGHVAVAVQCFPDWDKPTGRHKTLSLLDALRHTLCRLRRNATHQDLHEDFRISPSTAWDYHQTMVAFLADALGTSDQAELSALVAGRVCLIDGTLIPTANWRHRRDLYSSRHRKHRVNVELLVDPHGQALPVQPAPAAGTTCTASAKPAGSSWSTAVVARSATWATKANPTPYTPIKKPQHRDFTGLDRDLNRSFARIRVGVEWAPAT